MFGINRWWVRPMGPEEIRQWVRRTLVEAADNRAAFLASRLPGRLALQEHILQIVSRVADLYLRAPINQVEVSAYLDSSCTNDPEIVREEANRYIKLFQLPKHPRSNYTIVPTTLGTGGFGTVFKAREVATGEDCVVKFINNTLPQRSALLVNEAEAQERLSNRNKPHPNIVAVYAWGRLGNDPFIAMEFVGGGNLADALGRKPLSPERSARLVRDIALAVDYAHQNKVVHRDIKPANVLLTPEGIPKLTDFGLAREIRDDNVRAVSKLEGTKSFLAPEQVPGSSMEIGAATDIHALGCLLYYCLTGAAPFDRPEGPPLYGQISREYPLPMHRGLSSLSSPSPERTMEPRRLRDLETIYLQASRKRPEDRYPNARALADDLENWLEEKPIRARRPGIRDWWRRKPETAALVFGSWLLVLVGLVSGFVWYQARLADQKQRVEQTEKIGAGIAEVYAALEEDRFSEAQVALERARGHLGLTPKPDQEKMIATAQGHFAAVVELDAIREERTVLAADDSLPITTALERYKAHLVQMGYDLQNPKIANMIRQSPVRRALLIALDDWATHEPNPEVQTRLWQVAREADPDPLWGNRFRDPAVRRNAARLAALAAAAPIEQLSIAQVIALVGALPKDNPTTKRLLQAMEEKHRRDFWVNFALAEVVDSRGRESFEANRIWRREAVGYLKAALNSRPDSLGALVLLFKIYLEEGDVERAEACAHRMERLKRESWLTDVFLGRAAEMGQEYEKAITHFERALKKSPNNVFLLISIARIESGMGKPERALKRIEKVQLIHKDHPMALVVLANIRRAQGNLAEGEKLCLEAAVRDPENWVARDALASALLRRGRILEMEQVLDGFNPTYRERGNSAMCLAFSRLFRGEPEEAARLLDNAIQVKSDEEVQFIRIIVLIQAGRFTDARAALQKEKQRIRDDLHLFEEHPLLNIGLVDAVLPTLVQNRLDELIRLDAKLKDRIPSIGFLSPFALAPAILPQADYLLVRHHNVTATLLYERLLPENSWHGPWIYGLIGRTNRINAAQAAAQAWVGEGRDNLRATDNDRGRFRKLALRWLREELDDCRSRVASESTRDEANVNLHVMKLHRALAPVRDPGYLREMPKEDKEIAEAIWAEVDQLLCDLNPPLDLPEFSR